MADVDFITNVALEGTNDAAAAVSDLVGEVQFE